MSGYALADAEVILRLLLPARTAADRPTTWRAVARETGYRRPVHGGTSWSELVELPGHQVEKPRPAYAHPAGQLSEPVLAELVRALGTLVGADVGWHYTENADRGGSWSELAGAVSSRSSPALRTGTVEPLSISGTLSAISSDWATGGFHGRAWDAGHTVGIAANSYSDSLILSGPRRLSAALTPSSLEVFRIAAAAENPMTSE